MKKYLATTAVSLALVGSPALAGHTNNTDITQILHGVQVALNALYAGDGGADIDQAATNAGNIISRGADSLDDVLQRAHGVQQTATNYVNSAPIPGETERLNNDHFVNVSQAATNVLNSLSMESGASVSTILQDAHHTNQLAENLLFFDGDTVNVDQTAVNAVNLVSAPETRLRDDVDQVAHGIRQRATNDAVGDDFRDDLTNIIQSATNVANSVSAARVDDIDQEIKRGDQRAINNIEVYDDFRFDEDRLADDAPWDDEDLNANMQTAVNAANLISISGNGDNLVQHSLWSTQLAYNMVTGPQGYPTNPRYGDAIEDLQQTATNVTNSISVDGDDSVIDKIHQGSIGLVQSAGNLIDMGDSMEDVTQEATNAANIAQFDELIRGHHHVGAYQYWAGGRQSALNIVAFGLGDAGVQDLTQSATNVINSLSGNVINTPSGGSHHATHTAVVQEVDMRRGGQLAGNFVSFGREDNTGISFVDAPGLGLNDVTQTATNAANMISVDDLGAVTVQRAYVMQVAGNVAVPNLRSFRVGGSGDIVDLTQSATNAVNVISATDLPDISGPTDITQVSSGFQLATNIAATAGAVSGVTQAATNVANSISTPPGDDS